MDYEISKKFTDVQAKNDWSSHIQTTESPHFYVGDA